MPLIFQLFGIFIDQHLRLYDQLQNPADNPGKPIREVKVASLQCIDNKYYWVSSQRDIFLLNNGDNFAHKMSENKIDQLPVEIVFAGRESPEFLADEKRAFELIILIILKMNKMQTSKIYSFPLGSYFSQPYSVVVGGGGAQWAKIMVHSTLIK